MSKWHDILLCFMLLYYMSHSGKERKVDVKTTWHSCFVPCYKTTCPKLEKNERLMSKWHDFNALFHIIIRFILRDKQVDTFVKQCTCIQKMWLKPMYNVKYLNLIVLAITVITMPTRVMSKAHSRKSWKKTYFHFLCSFLVNFVQASETFLMSLQNFQWPSLEKLHMHKTTKMNLDYPQCYDWTAAFIPGF